MSNGVEYQPLFGHDVRCPYCQTQAALVDSAVVYGGRSFGNAWVCKNYPACDAYVGSHKETGEPLGTLANAELRVLRRACHAKFDPLWLGKERRMSRRMAYGHLQRIMGLPQEAAHIGMFDAEQCRTLLARLAEIAEQEGMG